MIKITKAEGKAIAKLFYGIQVTTTRHKAYIQDDAYNRKVVRDLRNGKLPAK